MRRRRNKSFFQLVALLVIISFSFVQPAWARGRRGGNSSGDLAMAAVGGAALPLGAVVGAGIAGGGFAGPAYQAALSSSTFGMAAGSIARAGLTLEGVDPTTTRWVSAGVSGLASGFSTVSSANLTGSAITTEIGKSMVSSMVSSEVGYQLNEAGVPLGGAIGSIAGSFAGGFTQGVLSGKGFSGSLSKGAGYAIGKNNDGYTGSNIGYAVASNLVSDAIVGMVDERSLARPYAGYVGGLGGRLAGHFAGTTMSGELNFLSPDYGKQARFGYVRELTSSQIQMEPKAFESYRLQAESKDHYFKATEEGGYLEFESYPELYRRGLDGRSLRLLQQSQ